MAIYGIGCDYDGKDVGNDFYTKGVACIGWAPEDKPYLYGIMKEIDIGDIIIIKSFFQRGGKQVLRIKAVGIVTDNLIKRVKNLGHCLEVKWLRYEADGITELEFTKEEFDAGVQRQTTIYKEYNPDVCKRIIELAFPD